jgi:hypothetical protein
MTISFLPNTSREAVTWTFRNPNNGSSGFKGGMFEPSLISSFESRDSVREDETFAMVALHSFGWEALR